MKKERRKNLKPKLKLTWLKVDSNKLDWIAEKVYFPEMKNQEV
jgi:hypothetical protein